MYKVWQVIQRFSYGVRYPSETILIDNQGRIRINSSVISFNIIRSYPRDEDKMVRHGRRGRIYTAVKNSW